MSTNTSERWLPIEGYIGRYEVSDRGRVRNVKRGKCLKPRYTNGRHLSVTLSLNDAQKTVAVHKLVLTAFLGEQPEGMVGCHGPNGPDDNTVSNLRWDTQSQNMYDAVRDGVHSNANKADCKRGHALAGANLKSQAHQGLNGPGRACRACGQAHSVINKAAKRGILLDLQTVSDEKYAIILQGVT